MMISGRARGLALGVAALALTVSGCGVLAGSGSPTPSAVASAPDASAAASSSEAGTATSPAGAATASPTGAASSEGATASPTGGASSPTGVAPSDPASPPVRVDPNDPTGVAASLGVTLVDAGDAGMVSNGLTVFRTPSGRIRCMLSDLPDAFARCDVTDATFTPPKKPADCDLDWGYGVSVSPGKRGTFFCGGDTVDNGPALAYGSAVIVGDLICISRTDGVTCRTATTALHGFRIARESYSLF